MSWDYTDWPVFSSPADTDPYPDVRSRISAGLASDLGRWATDMCVAYADETGLTQPPTSTADALDEDSPTWWIGYAARASASNGASAGGASIIELASCGV